MCRFFHVTIEAPSVHDLVHLAYLPIVQLHEPKQTLVPDAARHLAAKMREIIGFTSPPSISPAWSVRSRAAPSSTTSIRCC